MGKSIYIKISLVASLMMINSWVIIAQKSQLEAIDSFRIDYKDVYNNTHYNQPLRPQVHYTPLSGQIGDPTGLIRYKGKYHLFYMFDEWSRKRRDNKNWGHAISDDCIHWQQEPPVTNSIIDNRPGSGSGIIDWNNTLKLRTGVEQTMVIFYTDYVRGISLAFSRDAGKTWTRHQRNPVLPMHKGFRDPNVFWYKPDQSWRMIIYDEPGFTFYKSDNLLDWQLLSKMDGFYECPDIMQMPVNGKADEKKWVVIDGNGAYVIGEFNGVAFKAEGEKQYLGEQVFSGKVAGVDNFYTPDLYATQSWKETYEGDGPFYQLASLVIKGSPRHNRIWSQQLTFPVELTLKRINGKIQLCRNPIDGIKSLRYDAQFWKNSVVKPTENPLSQIHGDVFEILSTIDLGQSNQITFNCRGEKAVYKVTEQQLYFMGYKSRIVPVNNKLKLRFIIDRNSIEIYANEGEQTFSRLFYPEPKNMNLGFETEGGNVVIESMEIYKLESIWLKVENNLGYKRD